MGKYLISLGLLALVIVIVLQITSLAQKRTQLSSSLEELNSQIIDLEEQQGKILGEIKYVENEKNLEKELKSRFNYRRPEEKMFILVPPQDE